jgi:hypothetical protein
MRAVGFEAQRSFQTSTTGTAPSVPGRDCQKLNLARHAALRTGNLKAMMRLINTISERNTSRDSDFQTEIHIRIDLTNRLSSFGSAEIVRAA